MRRILKDGRLWLLLLAAIPGILPLLLGLASILEDPGEASEALRDLRLWTRLRTTLRIVIATLSIAIPLGLLHGWVLSRSNLYGRSLLLALVPIPILLPPIIHVLSWLNLTGLQGFPAIVLVFTLVSIPIITLLVVQSLQQVSFDQTADVTLCGGTRAVILQDLRHALPAALSGAALAAILIVTDFAVADFLSALGPKVTVYTDTLHVHHLAWRSAGGAAAALPGILLAAGILAIVLRRQSQAAPSIDTHFSVAPPILLGRLHAPIFLILLLSIGASSLLPVGVIVYIIGSWESFVQQVHVAGVRIGFTAGLAAAASTLLILLATPLASSLARTPRLGWVHVLLLLPLAAPALPLTLGWIRITQSLPRLSWEGDLVVLSIAMVGRYLAVALLPLTAAFSKIEPLLSDAAALDGAGSWTRFFRIRMPLVRIPILMTWCLTCSLVLREMDVFLVLGAGQRTLPFHLHSNVAFAGPDELASIALILIALLFIPWIPACILATQWQNRGE